MRRSILPTLLFFGCALSTQAAAPVHVTLKPDAAVTADADGFFTLGAISNLSDGDATERARLRGIPVGRAPMPGLTRRLNSGDVILKLRQAGLHPATDVVLDGAKQISITLTEAAGPAPDAHSAASSSNTPTAAPAPPTPLLVHRGDILTILIQDGALTISAKGVSRDVGRAGDVIHVHRDGVMTDLAATVLDAQTVQLEL